MSLLKSLLDKKLAEDLPIGQGQTQATGSLTPANPYNQRAEKFSLLRDIHGAEISTGDVVDHLQKVDAEEEAVDTVAFGLETTDGQIVKVYVNAEQAEEFEQKMSQMLGKVDDIDEAIDTLADEFDIVSVVKPGEDDVEDVDANPADDEEKGLENQLDEPLSDEDLAGDLGDQDLVGDEDGKEKTEKGKEGEEDSEDADGKDDEEADEKDAEDDSAKGAEGDVDELDFGDGELKPEDDKESEDEESEEDKPEGEESEDKDADSEAEDDKESEDKPEEDAKDEESEEDSEDDKDEDGKDKKKPKKDKKDKDMKQESQSLLKQLLSLNEAKEHHAKKPQAHKKEAPQHTHLPAADTTNADIFHMGLTKEESELEKIFTTPTQQLIYRIALSLGVSAESIAVRKFKVRKRVKDVALDVTHQPQVRNILNKLGKELASRRGEIAAVNEAEEDEAVHGTIKDQLSNEVTKKIYALILALGIPEFLLTYKKTGLKNRIRNLAKIAVKHARIRSYIYQLVDLLKANAKGDKMVKESHLSVELPPAPAVEVKTPSLMEDFAKSDNYADLGAFNVVDMGSVGGVELKVKDFTAEFSEESFEKVVKILGDGKAGVVKTENLGKVSLIPVDHGKEYVIKKVNANSSDKYPFGVLISKKSIDRILA